MGKKDLLGCSLDQLKEELAILGEKPFRAAQIYRWLHACVPFSRMTNLSLALRQKLEENYQEGYLEIAERLISQDGTRKYLLRLGDGHVVECVLMVYEHGNTLCLSTQVGCGMNCAFCASATGGFKRNLSTGELLGEVLAVNQDLGKGRNITNLVLMGTGEPLANYENVVAFLKLAHDPDGLGISYRNMSLSTCGLVPRIRQLAKEELPIVLCLSLHAASQAKREEIMPIAKTYDLEETLDALDDYYQKTGRRLVIEYTLIGEWNDTPEDAAQLAQLLKNRSCHVNLIPLNEVEEKGFCAPQKSRVYGFLHELERLGVSATVRRSLGRDIDGACGQLRAKYLAREANQS